MRRHVVFDIPSAWITVFVGVFSVYFIATNQEFILDLLGRSSTFTGRADIWKAIEVSLADKPRLGHGYGAYWSEDYMDSTLLCVIDDLEFVPSHSHNS